MDVYDNEMEMEVSYHAKPPCLHTVHLGRQRVFKLHFIQSLKHFQYKVQ